MAAWPDVEAYKAWARIPADDDKDDAAIALAVDATNGWVAGACTLLELEPDDDVPPDVIYACLLITNRLMARRNSPEGVVGGFDGVVAEIGRYDPDVTRLLGPHIAVKIA